MGHGARTKRAIHDDRYAKNKNITFIGVSAAESPNSEPAGGHCPKNCKTLWVWDNRGGRPVGPIVDSSVSTIDLNIGVAALERARKVGEDDVERRPRAPLLSPIRR